MRSIASAKRRGLGGLVGVIGFLLSPLSWWNDLFVNVPLALLFAWLVSCINRGAFAASFILGYWLTNVLGLVLMHWGAEAMFAKGLKPYTRKELAYDLVIALGYTVLMVILVKLRVFAPLPDYLSLRR
jgi:hypothetical protein